ncbi:MAG: SDR family oxidoreductase [Proteobacteria bacterium]|nr:SDR family oxidoreductase [Pseudomonadota bacterium]
MSKRRLCILGGCGGIGRSLVTGALVRGYDVAVMDLKAALEKHPAPPSTVAIEVDAGDDASVARAFSAVASRFGALDGFVNAAGFLIEKHSLADTSTQEFDVTITGNVRSTFLACKAAIALLEKGEAPSLVNITSGLGAYIRPHYGAYAASKAAMIALTKTLALEHAPRVRVNAVGPGPVDTAFLRGGTGRSDENAAPTIDIDAFGAVIPLKRIAVPDDIVGPVMFLLGDDSRFMTGQTLWVNGGAYMP